VIEIDLCPSEIRYRQCGLRRARALSASSARAGLAIILCLAAIIYVIIASALLRIRRDETLLAVHGAHENINSQAARKRQVLRERMKVSQRLERARQIGDLLNLLERSTTPGVSFSQLVARDDVVTLQGESADVYSLQALLSLLVREIRGSSATIESIREVVSEDRRVYRQFNMTVTLFSTRS